MFSDEELRATKKFTRRKMDDILDSNKEFTIDDLNNLQTLAKLKNAADQKIQRNRKND